MSRAYQRGDVLPTGFTGRRLIEHGAPMMGDVRGVEAATENVTLVPVEITPSQVNLDNVFCYTVIKRATVRDGNIILGDQSVKINNRFDLDIPDDSEEHDVVGITDYYDGPQFMPLEFREVTFPKYTITVVPPEHGTLTANFTEAEAGETITLTATPDEGYELEKITYVYDPNPSGAFFTVENNQFVMPPVNVRVHATFKLKDYKVVINQIENDNGTVTADKATAHYGDVVTVTTTPNQGYRLNSLYLIYLKDGVPYFDDIDMATCQFTMPAADVNVAHEFVPIDYNIYVDDATEHGSISVDKTTAHFGDVVNVTATPHEGYELETLEYVFDAGSIGNVHNSIDNGQFTMPAINVFVTGTFMGQMFNIETAVNPDNAGTISVAPTARFGSDVEVTATPAPGYQLKELFYTYYAGGSGADPKYTIDNGHFTMPQTDIAIVANFEVVTAINNFVNFTAPDHATISASLEDGTPVQSLVTPVAQGQKVMLSIVTDEGYTISSLKVTEGQAGNTTGSKVNDDESSAQNRAEGDEVTVTKEGENLYSFIMPASNVNVEVTVTDDISTAIAYINAELGTNVKYVNAMGQVSDRPFQGINIVIDGDKTYKIVVK